MRVSTLMTLITLITLICTDFSPHVLECNKMIFFEQQHACQ
jgi:hypothetical protein